MRKHLEALEGLAELIEHGEADQHPQLIGVGEPVLGSASGEMRIYLYADFVEALPRGRREAAYAEGVHCPFACPPVINRVSAGCVQCDALDLDVGETFDFAQVSERVSSELTDCVRIERGDIALSAWRRRVGRPPQRKRLEPAVFESAD